MLTIVAGGDIYAPDPIGRRDLLVTGGTIDAIGEFDAAVLERSKIEVRRIDASGCYVVPGFIDPHQHIIGAGGEQGFNTQTPEIRLEEILCAGITTVVGCLGVETTTKTMAALLAKAKALNADGLTAWIWSGGYNVPLTTLTESIRTDLMIIHEIIGAGEVAISDRRCTEATTQELARIVKDTAVGGMLSGKAGVTHFHTGDGPRALSNLRELLDDHDVDPVTIYPTHVQRNENLFREALDLVKREVTIDLDVIERDLQKWLKFFLDNGGDPSRITASSDASMSTPRALFDEIRACICELGLPIERVLPLVTCNTARVLKLDNKGKVAPRADADLLVIEKKSFEIRAVMARGQLLLDDGRVVAKEKWWPQSDRRFSIHGEKGKA